MTRAELMSRMSAKEYQAWKHIDLPQDREDWKDGMLWSTIFNAHRASTVKAVGPLDFMRLLDPDSVPPPRKQTPEEQMAIMKALAEASKRGAADGHDCESRDRPEGADGGLHDENVVSVPPSA